MASRPRRPTHFTFEPSSGLFPWWEIGGYFQMAVRSDLAFDYAGIKLRSKFVTPTWSTHWWLGLNIEVSLLPGEVMNVLDVRRVEVNFGVGELLVPAAAVFLWVTSARKPRR